MEQQRAHDCLVNVHFGDEDQPEWMYRVKNDYFKKDDSIFRKADMAAILDEMDAMGVKRAVLMCTMATPATGSPLKFAEARPDRFSLAMGGLDLLRPMPTLRKLESLVRNLPIAYATVGPSFWG